MVQIRSRAAGLSVATVMGAMSYLSGVLLALPSNTDTHLDSSPYVSDLLTGHEALQRPLADLPGSWQHRSHSAEVQRIVSQVDAEPPGLLSPAVQEFKDLVESNPRIYMYFVGMFDEIPWRSPYWRDFYDRPQIRDYHHFFQVLNHIIVTAPGIKSPIPPLAAILAWPIGTASGFAAFLDPDVNKALKKVLIEWGQFLKAPASLYALGTDDDGWFGTEAITALEGAANAPYNTTATFEELYDCDASKDHHGFTSWDDFFTRRFRDGIRPVASPDDDNVVVSACESTVYRVQRDSQLRDKFFVKGEPYSVLDMLGHDALAPQFAGATVFQAFLSLLSYHRWHAPVSGVVRRAFVVDGTYYSEPLYRGNGHPNVTEINRAGIAESQAYLTALNTRAVIIIEADNPDIGLLAFVAVGMEEISSCEITVDEGQHVKKGDELGAFHFGGSSYCLLFQNGVKVGDFPPLGNFSSVNDPVRGKLTVVTPSG